MRYRPTPALMLPWQTAHVRSSREFADFTALVVLLRDRVRCECQALTSPSARADPWCRGGSLKLHTREVVVTRPSVTMVGETRLDELVLLVPLRATQRTSTLGYGDSVSYMNRFKRKITILIASSPIGITQITPAVRTQDRLRLDLLGAE